MRYSVRRLHNLEGTTLADAQVEVVFSVKDREGFMFDMLLRTELVGQREHPDISNQVQPAPCRDHNSV